MPVDGPSFPILREAVASFPDKARFRDAVRRLQAAGFKPADLSVLASHDSLEVAGGVPGYPGSPAAAEVSGLIGEIVYLGPLTIAGIILVSGGPVAAGMAALLGAGLGGAALKDVLDHYMANRHSAAFTAALAAGAVLLWVRIDDPEMEPAALRILEEAGGRFTHMHGRPETPAPDKT